MSTQQSVIDANLELIETFNTTVFVDNDLDRIDEFVAPSFKHIEEGDVRFTGLDELRTYFTDMLGTWDSLEMDVISMVGDADRVMYNFEMSAVAADDLEIGGETYEVEGESFNWDGFVSLRIDDGRIVEAYLLGNDAAILRQLGVIPRRAA